jgi:hypothetical protein
MVTKVLHQNPTLENVTAVALSIWLKAVPG